MGTPEYGMLLTDGPEVALAINQVVSRTGADYRLKQFSMSYSRSVLLFQFAASGREQIGPIQRLRCLTQVYNRRVSEAKMEIWFRLDLPARQATL